MEPHFYRLKKRHERYNPLAKISSGYSKAIRERLHIRAGMKFQELISKIAFKAFWMPFEPKRLKKKEKYGHISTSSEAVAGQGVPKRPEDYF